MDGKVISARFGKGFDQDFRATAHEMDVEGHFGQRAYGADDGRAEGDVRNEVAIHDVKVEPIRLSGAGAKSFFG